MTRDPSPRAAESERRLRHNVRLARLLRFLELVSGRGRWTPKSLTDELEVSERTIHRLRETLELAGIPLVFDRAANAYRVGPGFRFPPLNVTEDEALGQAAAAALAESPAVGLPAGSKAVTRKLAATADNTIGTILEDATRLVQVLSLQIAGGPGQQETIRTVQRALLRRRTLVGRYKSPYEPAAVDLTLHPYRLALVKQAYYLVARPDGEDRPRTYRLVRFQTLAVAGPAAEVPADFDLEAYFADAWAVYRGDRSYVVELRFAPDAADAVTETTWHRTQQVRRHADGSVTLTFTVDGLNEILRWVVGWAGRVRVLKPAALRDLVVRAHRRAIETNRKKN